MNSLENALSDHELLTLRVIGEWWELDLAGSDKAACVKTLAEKLSKLDMVAEMSFLPREDVIALSELVSQGGRIPVAAFARVHGDVRMMGPGRLEREEPWLDPVSAAEALWYRGFLYRGFDETAEGMIEYYYLPQELLAKFPQEGEAKPSDDQDGRTLEPVSKPESRLEAVTDAVDDLTGILILAQHGLLQRSNVRWERDLLNPDPERASLLMTLAQEAGLLRETDGEFRPTIGAVDWLKESRESQLTGLADAWSSSAWNELQHVPGIICEGEGWHNDPILARTALLDALPRTGDWFRIDDLVELIKRVQPDFQRPDGNYDTWYVREIATDTYLTGFDNWDGVEGRLLRFLLQAPCYWLGLVETSALNGTPVFRQTARALDWMAGKRPAPDSVQVPPVVHPDGTLLVPINASRYQRFQIARVCEAEPVRLGQPFRYRLSPHSLTRAREQGITPSRILQFLEEASGRSLPASTKRAVTRWSEKGTEARLESAVVLRVRDAATLDTLRNNPKTREYIAESLGDLAVVVRPGDWPHLVAATGQLGLLVEVTVDD